MTTLTCTKCRQAVADDALDLGQCPACGFPIDGPVVLGPRTRSGGGKLFLALGAAASLVGGGFAGFALLDRPNTPAGSDQEVAAAPPVEPEIHLAPMPHESKPPADSPTVDPAPNEPTVVVEAPRKDRPRPVGVVMKIDPKIAPVRHFDHPDDTAALPDLGNNDRVVLTGRVRVLRIGSVNGKGRLDASGLVTEEILITGDLNNKSEVTLQAPGGRVTIGGFVMGSAKLVVVAPGGEVLVANSARLTGNSRLTITAKRLEARGPLSGDTEVKLTLSANGSVKLALLEEHATVTYRKSAPGDPPVRVEQGVVGNRAKLRAEN